MAAVAEYDKLVEKGCLCGIDSSACALHGPGDNRGLAAFFRAGTPQMFPYEATCSICGAGGLMYPWVELDNPKVDVTPGECKPTLICPNCSTFGAEFRLRREAEESGLHALNAKTVFLAEAAA